MEKEETSKGERGEIGHNKFKIEGEKLFWEKRQED